jgi:cell division protease FtsH
LNGKLSSNDKSPYQNEKENLPQKGRLGSTGCSGLVSRSLLWLIITIALSFWVYNQFGPQSNAGEISYTRFKQQVQAGNVSSVTITGDQIQGQLVDPVEVSINGDAIEYEQFVTQRPAFGDDGILQLMESQDIEVRAQPENGFPWLAVLINGLPLLLLLGVGYYYLRSMRGQGQQIFSIGKSKAKLYDRRQEGTTFADVAGLHSAKAELREIIDFLREPERFQRLGGKMPTGVLLVGPPGTGKTLLARAVAGEAGVPFFSITGSDFMEMFVGVGASRVRDLFEEAKKAAPSIIFIDELDSIGRRRGAGLGGGHDEREQTLNQLLSEMDGFEANQGVIVMAATNRPDILDPALLRPGRFDRRVTADLPTMKDRLEVLKIHSRNKKLDEGVDLEQMARGTPGFSGADLENLLNEAALLAARKNKDSIGREDVEEARDKIMLGLERVNLALTDEECKLLAYHEAGHAIVAAVLPNADPIHKVTIVPRGRAMGVTQQLPERDRYIIEKPYIMDRLAVMMGGRAAENLALDTTTSGAENDLKQATGLARKMVLDWGMSERFAQMSLGSERDQVFLGEEIAHRRQYSEETARQVDQEVMDILQQAFLQATKILEERRRELDQLVEILLKDEEISGDEVIKIVSKAQGEPIAVR